MKAVSTFLFLLAVAANGFAAEATYSVNDPVAGVYYGTYKTRFAQGPAEAQIRSLGGNKYDGVLCLKTVKDGSESIVTISKIHEFTMKDGKAVFSASHPNQGLQGLSNDDVPNPEFIFPGINFMGEVTPGRMEGQFSGAFLQQGDATLTLTKVAPKPSPTLGAKPPKDAIVLFDGKRNEKWKDLSWDIKDGALQVGSGNITTKDKLGNALLHIEFRTPFMPGERGQARGNSGVYVRSVFEVQVLDSFGKFPLEPNDCGGIYQVAAPDWKQVNACLPPGEWQTYDITFREGNQAEGRQPTISVVHNGKVVVSNAVIREDLAVNGTGGGEVDGGFLMLQDHGNPVQFRNIWVQPID